MARDDEKIADGDGAFGADGELAERAVRGGEGLVDWVKDGDMGSRELIRAFFADDEEFAAVFDDRYDIAERHISEDGPSFIRGRVKDGENWVSFETVARVDSAVDL